MRRAFSQAMSMDRVLLFATGLFLLALPAPHTTTIRLSALAVAVIVTAVLVAKRGVSAPPLMGPFVAWTAVALISLLYAVDPLYSVGEIKAEIVYGFLAYFVFYTQADTPRHWTTWLWVLFASLLLLSLANIAHWFTTGEVLSPWYFYNGVGAYTTYWITIFPLVLLLFFRIPARGIKRVMLRAAPFLFIVPAVLTRNRAIWFAFAASCAVLFALIIHKVQPSRRMNRVLLSMAIVGIAIVLFYGMLQYRLAGQWNSINAEAVIEQTLGRDPRPEMWQFLVGDIAAHPWRGAGFGLLSFDYVYPQLAAKNPTLFHAHNVFLDAAVQMGIPGVLAMIYLFGAILREYWRLYRSNGPLVQWIGAAGIAIVIGVLLRNMTDDFFRRDLALLFWAVVGMTLGYGKHIAGETAQRTSNDRS
jgi:O-antigen ligase